MPRGRSHASTHAFPVLPGQLRRGPPPGGRPQGPGSGREPRRPARPREPACVRAGRAPPAVTPPQGVAMETKGLAAGPGSTRRARAGPPPGSEGLRGGRSRSPRRRSRDAPVPRRLRSRTAPVPAAAAAREPRDAAGPLPQPRPLCTRASRGVGLRLREAGDLKPGGLARATPRCPPRLGPGAGFTPLLPNPTGPPLSVRSLRNTEPLCSSFPCVLVT